MDEMALVIKGYDAKKDALTPRMIVIFTNSRIVAFGDPATFAGREADEITKRYAMLEASEIPAILDAYKDRYIGEIYAYGGKADMVPYSGKDKKKIDTIKDGFANTEFSPTLERTQGSK